MNHTKAIDLQKLKRKHDRALALEWQRQVDLAEDGHEGAQATADEIKKIAGERLIARSLAQPELFDK